MTVERILVNKLRMSSTLDDLSVVHYKYFIHVFQTDQAMSDQQRGLLPHYRE